MNKLTDGGLLALAGAGVGPGLEHLEFRGESPDFQFNSCCCFRGLFSFPSSPALMIVWSFVLICW